MVVAIVGFQFVKGTGRFSYLEVWVEPVVSSCWIMSALLYLPTEKYPTIRCLSFLLDQISTIYIMFIFRQLSRNI